MVVGFSKSKTIALIGIAFRYRESDAGLLSRYNLQPRSPATFRIDQGFSRF